MEKLLLISDEAGVSRQLKYRLLEKGYMVYCTGREQSQTELFLSRNYRLILYVVKRFDQEDYRWLSHIGSICPFSILAVSEAYNAEELNMTAGQEAAGYAAYGEDFESCLSYIYRKLHGVSGDRWINSGKNALLYADPLWLNPMSGSIYIDGMDIVLTDAEYEFLALLAQNCGRVFTYRQLTKYLWDEEGSKSAASLSFFIENFRSKCRDYFPVIHIKEKGYALEEKRVNKCSGFSM